MNNSTKPRPTHPRKTVRVRAKLRAGMIGDILDILVKPDANGGFNIRKR